VCRSGGQTSARGRGLSPEARRFLLIAQTPPEDLDRSFYFRSATVADCLFRAVVTHFLGETPSRLDKRNQLSALRDLGVYMSDLKPEPCDPREASTSPTTSFGGPVASVPITPS
jgi:hypothetical protein